MGNQFDKKSMRNKWHIGNNGGRKLADKWRIGNNDIALAEHWK
jgi:hypothetical protein